jgi:hypothetical protein
MEHINFINGKEKEMIAWAEDKGLSGDDSWAGLFEGASTMIDNAVIILVEDRFDSGLVNVLAPIPPDERGTSIPVNKEPAPVVLPKTATKKKFQDAMKRQARAILSVYREARIDITTGESL